MLGVWDAYGFRFRLWLREVMWGTERVEAYTGLLEVDGPTTIAEQ
jgi:hypothetical protein